MRQPFLIIKKDIRGKKSFYAKIWEEDQRSYSWKSVSSIKEELGRKGIRFPRTSKAGAAALTRLWISDRPTLTPVSGLFSDYLLSFWEIESDFIKGKALRGKSYSLEYIKTSHQGITKYFLPFLEATKKQDTLLSQVGPDLLESFLNYLADHSEIGNTRINAVLQSVKVPLSEAFRLGKIAADPGKKVSKLAVTSVDRVIFTGEEVRAFFLVKQKDLRFYAIHLLAATTGLRLGECRGLLKEDIKEGWIEVCHNWQDGEGIKAPKYGSSRIVPLPEKTQKTLTQLIAENPYGNDFVFYGSTVESPVGKRAVSDNFRNITAAIGIADDTRKERKLTFHAWRHFFNSMIRGEVPDHALRLLTGHKSEIMTDRYTSVTVEQRQAVATLANKITGGL